MNGKRLKNFKQENETVWFIILKGHCCTKNKEARVKAGILARLLPGSRREMGEGAGMVWTRTEAVEMGRYILGQELAGQPWGLRRERNEGQPPACLA